MSRKRLKNDWGIMREGPQDPIDEVNAIFRRRGITSKERTMIWHVMADVCMIQLAHKGGPFYKVMTKRLKDLTKSGVRIRIKKSAIRVRGTDK